MGKGAFCVDLHPGICAAVFSAGMLSFFSPCILPLLPVYLGYFSGGPDAPASMRDRLARALAFALGVSVTLGLMGMGAGLAGSVFRSGPFIMLCGAAVVCMGIHQMGLIRIPVLDRTRTLPAPIAPGRGLAGAFALGVFCSFGWTPCVGPALAMVLGVSLEQGDALLGGALLLVYVAGFASPFVLLAAGSQLLVQKLRRLHPHLGKLRTAGGLLVAVMGVWMIAGQLPAQPAEDAEPAAVSTAASPEDWAGKTVYLKFWATWCPLCLGGMEEFQELAGEYAGREDVAVCSVVAPGYNHEMDRETFSRWAEGQALSFPILLDEGGALNRQYGVQGYPTSVFLNGEGVPVLVHIGHMRNDEIREKLTELAEERGTAE